MAIETLGEAYRAGWEITIRCDQGKRDGLKSIRECHYKADLDMHTLLWTRGNSFPLSRLAQCMMCPRCTSRRVRMVYLTPSNNQRGIERVMRLT